MKRLLFGVLALGVCLLSCKTENEKRFSQYVDKFIGTGGNARVTPVASVPFGMMQIAPDTRPSGSGYHYEDSTILGFSHLHKSGGGCADFLDVLFLPLSPDKQWAEVDEIYTMDYQAPFSHEDEEAAPGYYSALLYGDEVKAELTATRRCGVQRYVYSRTSGGEMPVLVDLEYGSQCACTIQPEHDVDTVYAAFLEQVDDYSIRGYRKSNGWAYNQQVYFHTTFSRPIRSAAFYLDNVRKDGVSAARGRNVKLLLTFGDSDNELEVRTGLSFVDMEGARRNLEAEAAGKSFDAIRRDAETAWNRCLAQIEIETHNAERKKIFYTSLHNVLLYPMLGSDTDGRFRGPDAQVHQADGFDYYGTVVGLWDTFRAACPLEAVLHPEVMSDYVRTFLAHYQYAGQLPIWTLAGMETYQMIGIHALPVITNAWLNGVRGFDPQEALQAMVTSAMKDTCGYSMGYFVGLQNYKKYGYVPCDLEMEATARTLEYTYDDHAVSRLAALLGNDSLSAVFAGRAKNYRNVIDPQSGLARGRRSDGGWRTPFNPLQSEHRKDDYCEGNAWQWTFFAPHDVEGLAEWLGGKERLERRLDSLFTLKDALVGENVSGDISGLIGQYAHGNEPGQHTIYMYNHLNVPQKTRRYVHQVLTTLYDDTPEGICGNEDTGQMSAWYVFSALGLYPMDPASGHYELGVPLFDKATVHLPSGKDFIVRAKGLTDDSYRVDRILLNGKELNRTYITYEEFLQGGELVFEMSAE